MSGEAVRAVVDATTAGRGPELLLRSRALDAVAKENRLFRRWRATVLGRYQRSKTDLLPSEWVCKHTSLRGAKFSFKDHEYQIAPLNDVSQELCTLKPSQVGWTEIWIRGTLFYLVNYQGFTAIFTQPSQKQVQQFSKARVNPIIRGCRDAVQLGATGKALDAAELKQVGSSFLYLKGTKGTSEAISVPSDMNVYDERDFSVQLVINQYKSRLEHSKWGYERHISTPTIPRYGVSEYFERSDKKHRLARCVACGEWQKLRWPDSIWFREGPGATWRPARDEEALAEFKQRRLDGRTDEAEYLCSKCGRPLDRSGENMEWVAERPGYDKIGAGISGYSMSRMDVAVKTAWDVVDASDQRLGGYKRLQDFHNFCLGEPYLDKTENVSDEQFEAILDSSVGLQASAVGTFVGVDVGKTCNMVVQQPVRAGRRSKDALLYLEKFESSRLVDRIGEAIREFRPYALVVDAQPYEDTVNRAIERYPGIVWKARYGGNNYKLNEKTGELTVPRTPAIDAVLDSIRQGTMVAFAKGRPDVLTGETTGDGLKQHLGNIAKIHEEVGEDESEVKDLEFTYINTGPDHWVHAAVYANCGREVLRLRKDLKPSNRAADPTDVSKARIQ